MKSQSWSKPSFTPGQSQVCIQWVRAALPLPSQTTPSCNSEGWSRVNSRIRQDKQNTCKHDECSEEKQGLRQRTVGGVGTSLSLAGQGGPIWEPGVKSSTLFSFSTSKNYHFHGVNIYTFNSIHLKKNTQIEKAVVNSVKSFYTYAYFIHQSDIRICLKNRSKRII